MQEPHLIRYAINRLHTAVGPYKRTAQRGAGQSVLRSAPDCTPMTARSKMAIATIGHRVSLADPERALSGDG
jgi:hypothetical protein